MLVPSRLRLPAAILALTLFGSIVLHAQPADDVIVLSERLGPSIDSLEREYFGLFPGVGEFVAASIVRAEDGGALIRISLRDRADSLIPLSARQMTLFTTYIEEYEKYLIGERDFGSDAQRPYRPAGVIGADRDVRVELVDGRVVEGKLLRADDRGLVVMPFDRGYDWRRISTDATAVPSTLIDGAHVAGAIPVGIATGVATIGALGAFAYVNEDDRPTIVPLSLAVLFGGLLGGAGMSLFARDYAVEASAERYLLELPRLRSQLYFPRVEPPELRVFADSALVAAQRVVHPAIDLSFALRAERRFGIAVFVTAPATDVSVPIARGSFGQRAQDTAKVSVPALGFGLEATYDLVSWLDVGALVELAMGVEDEDELEHEILSQMSALAIADINVMPRRALGRQEMEVLVGVGAGAARMGLDVVMATPVPGTTQEGRMVSTVPTVLGRVLLRFSFSDSFAFHAGTVGRWFGTMSVPEYGYEYPTTWERGRFVAAHEISLTRLTVQLGARIMF